MDVRDRMEAARGYAFTAQQWDVIAAGPGPCLVVAGAGAGKTTVLAARVEWLVLTGRVKAEEILGLTFTRKAAAELAQGMTSALRGTDGSEDPDSSLPVVSTYHAYARSLVVDHGLRLGYEPAARMITDAARVQLARRVLRGWTGDGSALSTPPADVAAKVAALESRMSDHLVTGAEVAVAERAWQQQLSDIGDDALLTRDGASVHAQSRETVERWFEVSRVRETLALLADELRRAKVDKRLSDFGDQTRQACALASLEVVRAEQRGRYKVVVLDEYQDTSAAQAAFLQALFGAGHPVLAVGDPRQAIYGWRGASDANLATFPDRFPLRPGVPAPVRSLTRSNRCPSEVLDVANDLASRLPQTTSGMADLDAWPGRTGRVRLARALTTVAEAEWVADAIQAQPQLSAAVLARNRSDLSPVLAVLQSRGVPAELVGLGGLLQVPVVADLIALLRSLVDATDNVAMLRLLGASRWSLGPRDLAALGARAAALAADGAPAATLERNRFEEVLDDTDPVDLVSLAEAVADPGPGLSPAGLSTVADLAATLARLRRRATRPVAELLHEALRSTGLQTEIAALPQPASADAASAVDDVLGIAGQFSDLDTGTGLRSFLEWIDQADEHERGLPVGQVPTPGAVQLMTVHAAKGLEFDLVAVIGMIKGSFGDPKLDTGWLKDPTELSPLVREDLRRDVGLPALTRDGIDAYVERLRGRGDAEERRLGYVAVTRSRRELLLGSAVWGPTQKRARPASSLFTEVADHTGLAPTPGAEAGPGELNPNLAPGEPLLWPARADDPHRSSQRRAAELVRAQDPSTPVPPAPELAGIDEEIELLLAEARAAVAPVRTVVLPGTLTTSQLVALQEDPDRLAQSLARPLPRRPSPAARRGSRLHEEVERFFGLGALVDIEEVFDRDARDADDIDVTGVRAALGALPAEYSRQTPQALEEPFTLVVGAHVLRGRIDAVFRRGPESFEVVDWKTGSSAADPLQLAVYRLAVAQSRRVSPEAVSAAFVYLDRGVVDRIQDLPDVAQALALAGPARSAEVLHPAHRT